MGDKPEEMAIEEEYEREPEELLFDEEEYRRAEREGMQED